MDMKRYLPDYGIILFITFANFATAQLQVS